MATEGTPNPKASGDPASPAPGALALLTATALGSLVGSRLGGKPLAVAAGATVLALLNRKKKPAGSPPASAAPVAVPAPLPAVPQPPVKAALDPRIQDWLARQMDREERAAALEALLPEPVLETVPEPPAFFAAAAETESAAAPEEDDYLPEPLLPEAPAGAPVWQADTFATLTEPVPVSRAEPPPAAFESIAVAPTPPLAEETTPLWAAEPPASPPVAAFESFVFAAPPPLEPAPLSEAPRPVFATSAPLVPPVFAFPPVVEGSAIPGIEPLPSWSEGALAGPGPAVGDLDLESLFTTPVFQGSTLPDEIEVVPPPPVAAAPVPALAEAQKDPMAAFFQMPPPAPPPQPVAADQEEPVPEIAVHVAAAGEAWFDSPLADVPNPWQPPQADDEPPFPAPSSVHSATPVPVVEAEIVLRPRAPVQAAVVSKHVPPASKTTDVEPAEAEAELASVDNDLPRAPLQTPREQRARSTWRSWWRGD